MIKSSSERRKPAARAKRARRPRPAKARDRDTEQRILDAAHTVFVRAGTAGARTQEIAKQAGVNSALLHYYFRSKARLAEAVFMRAAAQIFPAVLRILGSAAALEDKVEQIVRVELDQLLEAPYLATYILSELAHHPERAHQLAHAMGVVPSNVGAAVFGVLRDQIAGEVRAGRMRQIAPEQFVVNLLSLCVFPFAARPMLMAVLGIDQPGFTEFISRRRKELASFFLSAIRP
jgi:AcrR family transcriptional regulator